MAIYIPKKRGIIKPAGFRPIDKSHPFMRDCVAAFYFLDGAGDPFEELRGKFGTIVGTSVNWVREGRGLAIEFTGNANNHRIDLGQITAADPLSLTAANQCTVIFRLRHGTWTTTFPRIIDKSVSASGGGGWSVTLRSQAQNKFIFYIAGSAMEQTLAQNLAPGAVHTLAVSVVGGSGARFFQNGQFLGALSIGVNFPATVTNAAIGNWNHSTDRQFGGALDYVLVYDRALTDGEILAIGDAPFAPLYRGTYIEEVSVTGPKIGTGALQASSAAVSGLGEASGAKEGTGALQATSAEVAGIGSFIWEGAGALTAGNTAVVGSGAIVQDGSGVLEAQGASVFGVGEVGAVKIGAGALQAESAAVSGNGLRIPVGSGTLQATDAAVSGLGDVTGLIAGNGALQAGSAAVVGVGEFDYSGVGALQAQNAAVAGVGFLAGDLTLTEADLIAIQDAVWAKLVNEGLVAQVNELWQRRGLDPSAPQTYDKAGNQIRVGGITIDLDGDQNAVTQTRQP